ncbi:MAG: hypothetical protein AB8B50_08285 [Pirellulaceae bacterium]
MTTNRIIVLLLANVAALMGIAYFATIDIRGIIAPLFLLTVIDGVAVRRILQRTANAEPHADHS